MWEAVGASSITPIDTILYFVQEAISNFIVHLNNFIFQFDCESQFSFGMFFYAVFTVENGGSYGMAFNWSYKENRYYAPTLSTFGLRAVDRRDEGDTLFYVSSDSECSINIAAMQDGILAIDDRDRTLSRVLPKLRYVNCTEGKKAITTNHKLTMLLWFSNCLQICVGSTNVPIAASDCCWFRNQGAFAE